MESKEDREGGIKGGRTGRRKVFLRNLQYEPIFECLDFLCSVILYRTSQHLPIVITLGVQI